MFNKIVDGEVRECTPEEVAEIMALRAAAVEAQRAAQAEALDEYMDGFRLKRERLLNALTGVALALDLLPEFRALRQRLLDLPAHPDVAKATTAEEAKATLVVQYANTVKDAPGAFVKAIKELEA